MLSSFHKLLSRTVLSPKETKNPSTKMAKQAESFASSSEPLLCKEKKRSCDIDVEENGVIRVKVKMTKQEAIRLMSKCNDGGTLEFRDVSNELVHIPVNRVSIVSSVCGYGGGMLKTIPEEN